MMMIVMMMHVARGRALLWRARRSQAFSRSASCSHGGSHSPRTMAGFNRPCPERFEVPWQVLPPYRLRYTSIIHCQGFSISAPQSGSPEISDFESWISDSTASVCELLTDKPWSQELEVTLAGMIPLFDTEAANKVLRTVPVQAAWQFFQWLKGQNFQHDFKTYHAIIDVLGEANLLDKMKSMAQEMQNAGQTMRGMVYRDMLHWCACHHDFIGVFSFWEDLQKEHIKPSAAMYTCLLYAHVKLKNYDAALSSLAEMIDLGLTPNGRTLSVFIDELNQLGKLEPASFIVSKLQECKFFPTMSTYASIMASYAKLGNKVELRKLGKDLRCVCDRPGIKFWAALASIHQEGLEEAAQIFAENVWPELTWMETQDMLNSCLMSKEKETHSVGSLSNGWLDSHVAGSYLQIERVLRYWDSPNFSKKKLTQITWDNDMVYELLSRKIHKPHVAWELFCYLRSELNFHYDVFNKVTMLRILSANHMFTFLASLISDLEKEGVKLTIDTFNHIIKDCASAKNVEVAHWVFERLKGFHLEPDKETFCRLLDAYAMKNNLSKAMELFEAIQHADWMLDSQSCALLIRSLGLAGQADTAERVFKKLLESGAVPCAQCYSALISAYGRAGNTKLALQTYSDMMEAGVVPVRSTYRSLAWVYLQVGDLQKMQECVRSIEKVPSTPKVPCLATETLMAVQTVLSANLIQQQNCDSGLKDH